MEKGWIKSYRRMLENSFLMNDNNAFLVFNKLLLMVGQEKGQWSGGRMQLAEAVNINPNTLKDVLNRLVDNGMISIESMKRYSIISIKNWHIYQNKPNGGEQKRTPNKTPLGKQRSFDDLTPDSSPRRHHGDTNATPMRHHSIKNKNREKEKEKESRLSMDHSEGSQRASPESVARARAILLKKLEGKKK
jgi:hypothetical protein